jgi:hypothetical protein
MDYSELISDCVSLVQDHFSVNPFVDHPDEVFVAIEKIKELYSLGNEYDTPLENEIGYFCNIPAYL